MFNLHQMVSVSDFRQNLPRWLNKAKGQNPIVILQNSKPKAVVIDPDYLQFLEDYANGVYDPGDSAEANRAINAGELNKTTPFNPDDYL